MQARVTGILRTNGGGCQILRSLYYDHRRSSSRHNGVSDLARIF